MARTAKFDALMERVCVGLGFCGGFAKGEPVHVTDFIPKSGTVTADQFVTFVLLGDGIDPANCGLSRELLNQIREAFIEHMGGHSVDARELRWSK